MPLKLNVGLTKDVELPDGSVEVSCGMEIRLDVASLNGNPDTFDRTVREAYDVCEHAVDNELKRQLPLDGRQATDLSVGGGTERLN
jgi:hypothetical protein